MKRSVKWNVKMNVKNAVMNRSETPRLQRFPTLDFTLYFTFFFTSLFMRFLTPLISACAYSRIRKWTTRSISSNPNLRWRRWLSSFSSKASDPISV